MRPYGFGVRPLGESDLYRLCDENGLTLVWGDDKFAFTLTDDLGTYINLPKRERGLKLLLTGFHELTHALGGHAGETPSVLYKGKYDDKNEVEADAMALIALIPLSHLGRIDFLDGSRIAKKIYDDRLRLYFWYGI